MIKFSLLGLIAAASLVFLPTAAFADTDLFKVRTLDDSFVIAGTDSTLARTNHELIAFSVHGAPSDSINILRVIALKTPGNAFIDSFAVYKDNNQNGSVNTGEPIAFYLTGSDTGLHSATFSNSTSNYSLSGNESFVLAASFNSFTRSADTCQVVFERNGLPGFSIVLTTAAGAVGVPSIANGNQTSLMFTSRIDSTNATSSALGGAFIHPDSRVGRNPFTVFSGKVWGETRGLAADRLRSIGIGFGGTAHDSVASAWILLGGRPTDTIPLTRIAGDTWAATVDSTLTVNRSETFLVRIMMSETVATPSTVWAYVPKDSVTTLIRPSGPATNSDSSGIFTLTRQDVIVAATNLGNTSIHPDSRAAGGNLGILVGSGSIMADTVTGITTDSVSKFGVGLTFGAGMSRNDVESVALVLAGETYTMTLFGAGADTWVWTMGKAITDTATFAIYVRARETTALNATVSAHIAIDSISTGFRANGPKSEASFNRTVTYLKQDVIVAATNLGNTSVHPDSRAAGGNLGVLLGSGSIVADTISGITTDSVSKFGVGLTFGAGMSRNDVESVALVLAGETYTMTLFGAGADTWVWTTGKTITDTASFSIYVRARETTAVNATVSAHIAIDSISTGFRLNGPKSEAGFNRTVTYLKQDVIVAATNLGNTSVHPDSRAAGGNLGILLGSGSIVADTVSGITTDSVSKFGVGLLFGAGMSRNDVESVALVLAGETYTMTLFGAGADTWVWTTGKTITDTASFAIYVRARETTAVNATVSAYISIDSISTGFRVDGPNSVAGFNRTVTYLKQDVIVAANNLGATSVHPDSRVVGGNLGVLLGSGSIVADTVSGITTDSVSKFGVGLLFGAGMSRNDVESVALVLAGETYTMTLFGAGADTWVWTAGKTITDTASFAIYVRARETTAVNATVSAYISIDSISTGFRVDGPNSVAGFNRTVTYLKQDVIVAANNLGATSVHPDSRVVGGNLGVLLGSGSIVADTVSGITTDSVSKFGVGLLFGAGMSRNDVESVALVLAGETYTMTLFGAGADTWVWTAGKTITDTASFAIYVRARETTAVNATVSAYISIDSISTGFRVDGPNSVAGFNRTVTYLKQDVIVAANNLGATSVHPDSRVVGGNLGVLLGSGSIVADTVSGITTDSVSKFGVGLLFGAGMSRNDVESVALVLAGETYTMTLFGAGADTWVWTAGKTITDTASFAIYVRARETTAVNATVSAYISIDSISTGFRVDGPNSVAGFNRTVTYFKQDVIVDTDNLADTAIHPDSRISGVKGVLLGSGRIKADTVSGITGDSIQNFGVSLVLTGGLTASYIESVAVEINGDTFTLSKVGALDSWSANLQKNITDTATYRIWLRVTETAPVNSTVRAWIMTDSISSLFRNGGPKSLVTSVRTVTFVKQQVIITMNTLGNASGHPDTRVSGVDSFLVSSGLILADTYSGITNDTITLFAVRVAQTGADSASIDSVAIVIDGETFSASRFSGVDGWRVLPNKRITNAAAFRVYVTIKDTTYLDSVGDTIFVTVTRDSITTIFRDSGPQSDSHSSRNFQETKPILNIATTLLATAGNDTINPILASTTPVIVYFGRFGIDTTLIPGNRDTVTAIRVNFGGTASDSVFNAQVMFDSNGTWMSMTNVLTDSPTWVLTGLDSQIVNNESLAIRINVSASAVIGKTLSCSVTIRGCTAVFSTPGPGVGSDSSGIFQINADAVQLLMFQLGDTAIPEFQQLGSNPILVCSGVILTNVGPVSMPTYDTLTSFGVQFDTTNLRVYGSDTIQAVMLYLWATPARPADTITMIVDGVGNDSRLWRLPIGADTNIAETQPFQVFVRLKTVRNMNNRDTLFVRVAKDSVNTTFTSGLAGDTHSSRIVTFVFPDTVLITQTTLDDTNVNPDTLAGENPFKIFEGLISGVVSSGPGGRMGQQYLASAGDSLTYFAIRLFSAVAGQNTSDSITEVIAYIGANESRVVLTRTVSSPAVPLGDPIWHWRASNMDSRLAVNNGDTFIVRARVAETVALGINYRIRAEMFGDSIQTYFMAESVPNAQILGARTVTFTKKSLGITATALTDTTVSPFKEQHESTVVLQATFVSTQQPSDSLTTFQVKILSGKVTHDSIIVKVEFLAGLVTPGSETTMVVDTPGLNPVFKLSGSKTVDSGQAFIIRVIPDTASFATATRLLGETLSARIETATAAFSVGTLNGITSGRTVSFGYVDTLVITDSALGSITIHPDSQQLQNPYIAYIGTFDGQTYRSGLNDTLQRVGFQFTGTAVGAGDSVQAAWVRLTGTGINDTISLVHFGANGWSANLDSTYTVNTLVSCTLYVQVAETIALGTTLTATIPSDSVSTRFQADTTLFTASRTVTFQKPRVALLANVLADTTIHPDSRIIGQPTLLASGMILADTVLTTPLTWDTVTRFGASLVFTGMTVNDVESVAVVINSETFTMTREAARDSWSASPNRRFADSTAYQIYINVRETTAQNATARALIMTDSVSSNLRLSGPASVISSGRVVTFAKARVSLTPDALANITVSPDSRIVGQPVLAASGRILSDTTASGPITADTVTRFGVSLVFSNMVANDVESVAVVINGETFTMSRDGALDSWNVAANKRFTDSTTYAIYLNVRETTVQNANVTALIMTDSITTTYRLAGPSAVVSSGRTVIFAKPGTQATMSTVASATIHPVFTQAQNPTTIMSGTISGDSTSLTLGDTLQVFQVNIRGTAKDSVTSCTLVIGPNALNVPLVLRGTSALGDTYGVNPSFTMLMPDSTADTFSVVIRMNEYVNQNGTVQAFIPARGLKTLFTDSGPSSDTTSGATFTYTRGTMKILTQPRNIGFTSAIQFGDTKEVMWFRAQISDTVEQDTIRNLTINLLGPDSTKFTHVYLVRDYNQNQKWDTYLADSIIGQFSAVAGTRETWTINLDSLALQTFTPTDTIGQDTFYAGGGKETAQYLIVVRISDTSHPSVRCRVPIGGADGFYSEPNAVAALYDSYTIITPDSNPPLPPFDFTLAVNAGNFVLTFGPSPSGDTQMTLGQYNIYWDSGLGTIPETIMQALPHVSGQLSYSVTISNLTPDSQYRFALKSQDQAGNQGNATSIISAIFRGAGSAAAPVGATIVEPTPGDIVYNDSRVGASKTQLVAQLTTGTVSACSTVLFYIRPITGGAWTLIGAATDSSFDATGISYYSLNYDSPLYGLYEIRARALSLTGILDTYAYSFTITTTTDTGLATSVNLPGTSVAFDTWYRERVISTRFADDFLLIRTMSGAFDVVVRMAMGSLQRDTDRMIARSQHGLQTDTLINAVRAAGGLVPEYWIDILLQSGQTTLNGNGATITVNYLDANFDGIDDSTGVDMSKAKIYTVSAAGTIEELTNLVFDKVRRTLSARVAHFSPFFVSNAFGTNASGLNQLIVGPNPFRPNDANDQTGKPFSPGDATSGIMFKNLPNQIRIEIYTILGEKVIEINKSDANATINWGAVNSNGKPVASGYYLYVVTDIATGQRVTGKLAVIR